MAIRVLIVEDSPIASAILKRLFEASPELTVVGIARTGVEGLAMVETLDPQVICTDLHMPQMDGLQLTQEVMARFPRPILVISASVQEDDRDNVFRLLDAGAVDIIPKPRAGLVAEYEAIKQQLIDKVRVLAGVKVFRQVRRSPAPSALPPKSWPTMPTGTGPLNLVQTVELLPLAGGGLGVDDGRIVAIGASTGGPQALQMILGQLPADWPLPVICVQHISDGFLQGLLDWLANHCHLKIKIAQGGEAPQKGFIYFPPERCHLEVDHRKLFRISTAPPVVGHRPSVTVTLESVAKVYGKKAIGVLLTGMGRDGADGMAAIAQAGGFTLAQDQATSVVFGMPKEAIALGAVKEVLPIEGIATRLLSYVRRGV